MKIEGLFITCIPLLKELMLKLFIVNLYNILNEEKPRIQIKILSLSLNLSSYFLHKHFLTLSFQLHVLIYHTYYPMRQFHPYLAVNYLYIFLLHKIF